MMRLNRILIYFLLMIFAIFYLTPIYVLFITSMKSFAEVDLKNMWKLPKSISFESFVQAWFGNKNRGLRGLSQNFMNSVYLVIPATIISAFLGSMNGYVLTKWKFKGADIIFPLILFGMFIPYQSILIPLVQILQKIKLYSSIPGLIFLHVVYGIPITTLIFRNY